MGGGILPMAVYKNKKYFLIGREYIGAIKVGGLWSDFGGRKNKKETFEETAIREGFEETDGIIGNLKEIEKLVKDKTDKIIKISNEYKMYIIEIEYDPDLPKKFREQFLKVKKENPELINTNGLYEKDMIKWVESSKIKKDYKMYRNNFKRILKDPYFI